MNKDKTIKQLLDKFYRGETSREEELLLSKELDNCSSSNQWEEDKELLQLLCMKVTDVPNDLQQQMDCFINSMEQSESSRKRKQFRYALPKISNMRALGIVASLLIIVSIALHHIFLKEESTPLLVDTYDNPEEANRATMQALKLFATNFSKGTATVEQVDRHIEEMFEYLYPFQKTDNKGTGNHSSIKQKTNKN